MTPDLGSRLASNWWALALRGALAILFGLIALFMPGVTLTTLMLLFAAYMLLGGILAIVAGIRAAERHGRSMPLFFEGALNILVAILAAVWPDQTIIAIVYIVGAWALLSGGFLVVAAMRLRGNAQGEFLLGLLGLLAIVFGIVLFAWPGAAAVAFSWWIGIFALLFGVTMVGFALRLKKRHEHTSGV
ncbi:MAG: HdeD family acid-resistance protein [Alphaproteobacteria bacterium]